MTVPGSQPRTCPGSGTASGEQTRCARGTREEPGLACPSQEQLQSGTEPASKQSQKRAEGRSSRCASPPRICLPLLRKHENVEASGSDYPARRLGRVRVGTGVVL